MRLRVSKGWAVTVLLASVGCGRTGGVSDTGSGAGGEDGGPVVMALDYVQSGSRLVALGYSSNEAKLFRTFHDAQLGFDCVFVPDAAGEQQRCVPSSSATVVYTDAACTEPAAWSERLWGDDWRVGDAVSGVANVVADVGRSCPGEAPPHRAAYRLAQQLSEEVIGAPAFSLFQLRDSRCQPASLPAKVTPPVYRLVPLAESELARADRVSLNVGEGLRLTRLLADDGAALNLGVTGTDRTPCEFQRDGECVPEPIARPASAGAAGFTTALNADCSKPAYQAPFPTACGTASFGVDDDGQRPLQVRALEKPTALFSWEIALPVTDPLSFRCDARTTYASEQVAAPGRDLTGTLPTAHKLRRGVGPLHVDWFSVGQSELLPVLADSRRASPGVVPTAEFVNAAGQACQVMPADDGTLHCAVVDDTGNPVVDLTTFPEVVLGPI